MITLSATEAAAALGVDSPRCAVAGVSIDSRSVQVGDLFIALAGERFDGHDYVVQALAAGACGALVEESTWKQGEGVLSARERSLVFPVKDTLAALGSLARAVRRKSRAQVIAVTGSVGKTGTKDLIGSMGARVCRVALTAANQNNEIGVPLTLLSLDSDTELVVVEMGMRGRGQIAALARIAEPDVGIVTNVHAVHLELVGSLENVAEAKAELFFGIRQGGVAVLPYDSPSLDTRAAAAARPIVHFGFGPASEAAEVRGEFGPDDGRPSLRLFWPEGSIEVETSFSSRHRMENAVAAAAGLYAAGLPLEECAQGLSSAAFTPSRGDVVELPGITIVNDTYNASPAATRAAIDDLMDLVAKRGGRAVVVFGDMLELGPEAARYHWEVGAYAAEAGVVSFWGVGPLSRHAVEGFGSYSKAEAKVDTLTVLGSGEASHVESLASGGEDVLDNLRSGDVVLMKASRRMHLEALVDAAAARFGTVAERARGPIERGG